MMTDFLCCRGRILHGRHFTFKDANGDTAITMVTEGVDGSYADAEHPFAAKGPWLHIFLKQAFVAQMIADIDKKSQVSAKCVTLYALEGIVSVCTETDMECSHGHM